MTARVSLDTDCLLAQGTAWAAAPQGERVQGRGLERAVLLGRLSPAAGLLGQEFCCCCTAFAATCSRVRCMQLQLRACVTRSWGLPGVQPGRLHGTVPHTSPLLHRCCCSRTAAACSTYSGVCPGQRLCLASRPGVFARDPLRLLFTLLFLLGASPPDPLTSSLLFVVCLLSTSCLAIPGYACLLQGVGAMCPPPATAAASLVGLVGLEQPCGWSKVVRR